MTKHLQNSSFQGLSVSTITFLRGSLPNTLIYYVHTLKDERVKIHVHTFHPVKSLIVLGNSCYV